MKSSGRLIREIKSRFQYTQPVYVPGYEYKPWKRWAWLALACLIALFIGINTAHSSNNARSNNASTDTSHPQGDNAKTPRTGSTNQTKPENKLNPTGPYQVVKVIDGDTFDLAIDGRVERLRLIGMDTPETVDPRKTVQCYGSEASNKAKEVLNGKSVYIESDPTQGDRDKYGRLLRYVYLEDRASFNKLMISQGYAHEYTYNIPYKYQADYKKAQQIAKNSSLGLWSPASCNGDTSQSASTPQSTTNQISQQQPEPSGNVNTSTNVYYANCTSARSAGAAPIYANEPGYRSALDRDNDKVACE